MLSRDCFFDNRNYFSDNTIFDNVMERRVDRNGDEHLKWYIAINILFQSFNIDRMKLAGHITYIFKRKRI